MVVAQGTRVVIVGVANRIAAALGLTRALGTLLFDVAPLDLVTFAGMSAAMIAIGSSRVTCPRGGHRGSIHRAAAAGVTRITARGRGTDRTRRDFFSRDRRV
jgi:hypothetical protein